MERIIDISDSAASLSVRYEQLVLRSNGTEATVPLDEIAALIVAHPAVVFTHAVLTGLAKNGAAFLVCDDRRMPVGMLLPFQSNSLQSARLTGQVTVSAPVRKQIWKQIVAAKVRAQASLLGRVNGDDGGLIQLAGRVKSGDPENIESQAAQRYWPLLFGDAFHRRAEAGDGVNGLLNYGYAVLRAIVARSICAAGLHPSLGVHHHNRYDAFCLANDIMEPFRPIVDRSVCNAVNLAGFDLAVDKDSKSDLVLALVKSRYRFQNEERTLTDWIARVADSLGAVYQGRSRKLMIPEFEYDDEKQENGSTPGTPF